jgi:methionyl-tRNA synthetase
MSKKFYISTAIHYVNDLPHIGHMYENIVADVIARHRRRMGDDVWFLTGTDEHGQKVERSAAKEGIAPIELADRIAAHHRELWKTLEISNDDFIRTTEARHRIGVHELIKRIQERNPGDIYLGEHAGWYCQSEETFIPDNQVVDGKDEAGHTLEQTKESNYFFKLSAYAERLLAYYREHPDFIQPPTRRNEVVAFVESGLKDLSISRTAIKWGIPFPGDPEHVVYVWMDALTNYISALGFGSADDTLFQRFWPADIHLLGKDIIRFHAVYWPAFLMAAGVELPKKVVGHGWWLRDGRKISKSEGHVVRPYDVIEQFGADAFRYFVMRDMVFGQDANYSDEAFATRYNSDLANDLGNTLSRALKMCDTYFEGRTPPIPCGVNDLRDVVERIIPEYMKAMDELAFQRALEAVWRFLTAINAYIVSREPWRRFKTHGANDALSRILWIILESLRFVFIMLAPFMPGISRDALQRIGADPDEIGEQHLRWGRLRTDRPITVGESLFPRIDIANYIGSPEPSRKNEMSDSNTATAATETTAAQSNNNDATAAVRTIPAETTAATSTQSGPPAETTQAMPPDAARITIDQFTAVDLRVAEVRHAEKVEKSKKLMKLRVFTGDEERTIVAGIATKYTPEELIGRKIVIVANLQPAKLMGIESNGMVLAASIDGEPSLLSVDAAVPAGTKVK